MLVVHQALGAVDQHHAPAAISQQLGRTQGDNNADEAADQSHRLIDHVAAEISYLLAPEIKAVMHCIV